MEVSGRGRDRGDNALSLRCIATKSSLWSCDVGLGGAAR